jgi:hypothetical protein
MLAVMIDTLPASEQLEDAGLPAEHTRTIARLMSGAQVAARDDLVTKGDLEAAVTALRLEMGSSAAVLRAEFKASQPELKADMVRWLIGSQAVLPMAIVGLAKAHLFG